MTGKDVQAGPKLNVVRHTPNHPTTFGRNFECEMIFASFRRESLRVSIRGSVVASKVLYVQHVKENRWTLILAKNA